jgi:hypothetical protein
MKGLVPRTQRSAPFFTAWCAAEPGPSLLLEKRGPGSAEQREERCTASGTRRRAMTVVCHPADAAGIGSAVTDLIFSIAKREVTFFKLTAPINFL